MNNKVFLIFLAIINVSAALGQETIVKGSVKDGASYEPIPDVIVSIESSQDTVKTNELGQFIFLVKIPFGEQILKISKPGYLTKRYPIVINEGKTVNIQDMTLESDRGSQADLFTITLTDDELNDDTNGADNISGLLSSSKDVFHRTAAFEFSSSFFKVRGLDSDNSSVLINGIEMNKPYNGRPQWSNWGGLNDVTRNQEFSTGLTSSNYSFGGLLGVTNINTQASNYKEGGRVTYSFSNRSYTNRLLVSYASGLQKRGWAYVFMLGRRWGDEGFQNATLYDSNSFFASVENKINDNHSLNLTTIYAPNRRGKSSANTQEVYDLKDIKYNEYWGWQDGKKRNSRIKEVDEPILILNHIWKFSSKASLKTNIGYQFGKVGNSRLDYGGTRLNGTGDPIGGGVNPSPSYYQKLPSFWLAQNDGPNYENAYLSEQEFIANGQIDWNSLYQHNLNNLGGLSTYALYEDRNDDKLFTMSSIFNKELSDNIVLNASVNYRKLKSENFAEIIDLLGGNGFLNIDAFDGYQFDFQNPNQIAGVGDKFRYNYKLFSNSLSSYLQAEFRYNKIDFYLSGSFTSTNYQREGLYQNEAHLEFDNNGNMINDNSSGKGRKVTFTGIGSKAWLTYKITGKHVLDVNAGYIIKAPSLRNTFSNSRESNDIVGDRNNTEIREEKLSAFDISYIFRSHIVKAKASGYYINIKDANEISFFYADGLSGFENSSAFVQEILQGIEKQHIGLELGIEAQVTPTIKLKGVAALGQYTYNNNPMLYLTSADFDILDYGRSNLKNYKIAGGPQKAFSVGFEYRDPDYWWFGATSNFFSDTYLDVSPLNRTRNFYSDTDGLPFNDYDEVIARNILKQEQFDSYMVVNLVGGKSWRIGNKYVGFFASINNLLDKQYKSGGFEQSRNANYRELRDDSNNKKRVFGPKYWYGRGTTFFVNMYLRF